jgi:hypothetical protein
MSQVYLSQFSRRAGIADTASYAMNATPAPLDTYIQYNKEGKFGAEIYFRYIYPIHSFQHGDNTNALGNWSHAEGVNTFTGFANTYSSSILSGSVTLSAEYGNITSSFRTGDYIYLNDYEFDNIQGTTIAKINSTLWDDTSSYIVLDVDNIHATTSFVGSLGTFYIKDLLGDKISRAYAAHSEGASTYAMGIGAHSEGSESYAIGRYSHTEGNNTVALGDYQTIVGQYNVFNTSQSAFIIGDGYARIIASGNIASSPTTGSSKFNIYSQFTPLGLFTSSIVTLVSASSSVSETFPIIGVVSKGPTEYELTIDGVLTQNYYNNIDTISVLNITRHNLLFASQSHFQVSASNTFFQGLNDTAQQNVVTIDPVTGQIFYTSSNALSAVSTPLDIYDDNIFVKSGPTSITFTGSGVSASDNGTGVDVYIPYSPNFATADLTFTGNRNHNTNNYWYFIYSNLIGGTLVSGGYHYFDNDSNSIGVAGGTLDTYTYIEITSQSIDLSFNGNPGVPSVYSFTNTTASFSSSIIVTGSVYFPGLTSSSYPAIVVIDTASGQLYYSTASVGGTAVLLQNLTTNITVGGSDSGTLYTAGTLLEDILRDILTDYFDPTLTLNYLRNGGTQTYPADTGTYVEVSRSISFNTASFTSQADNPGGNYPYSASFTASGATIGNFNYYFGDNVVTASNNLGVGSTRTINRSTPDVVTFTIQGTHPSSSTLPNIVDTATLTYVYPIYYGMSAFDYSKTSSNLNASLDLTKGVVAQESTQDILLNDTGKFIYFAFPSGWNDLASIRDLSTNFEYLGSSPAFISYSMANQSGSAATPWANQTYTVYQYYANYPNGTNVNSKTYRFTFL